MRNDPHSALPGGSDFSEGSSRKPALSRSPPSSATYSREPHPLARPSPCALLEIRPADEAHDIAADVLTLILKATRELAVAELEARWA